MSDQEKIEKLQNELAHAIGAIEALADIARITGSPKTADHAMLLATGYLQTLKETES